MEPSKEDVKHKISTSSSSALKKAIHRRLGLEMGIAMDKMGRVVVDEQFAQTYHP